MKFQSDIWLVDAMRVNDGKVAPDKHASKLGKPGAALENHGDADIQDGDIEAAHEGQSHPCAGNKLKWKINDITDKLIVTDSVPSRLIGTDPRPFTGVADGVWPNAARLTTIRSHSS